MRALTIKSTVTPGPIAAAALIGAKALAARPPRYGALSETAGAGGRHATSQGHYENSFTLWTPQSVSGTPRSPQTAGLQYCGDSFAAGIVFPQEYKKIACIHNF